MDEPVGLPIHLESVDVVREPVEEGAGEALFAEIRGPLVEGQVRGDDTSTSAYWQRIFCVPPQFVWTGLQMPRR